VAQHDTTINKVQSVDAIMFVISTMQPHGKLFTGGG
jgi:hypothetical protein